MKTIYEDDDYLVLDKPAGLVVHEDGRTKEPTLADWILSKYPELKQVGEPITLTDGTIIYRPGIVHRIDRDTSGVLVVAKNQKAHEFLKKQFQSGEVQKKYNCFVYGVPPEEEGGTIIDRPIGRSSKDFRLWSAQRGAKGTMREAVTEYVVLIKSKDCSYLEVRPRTGRTHQIRVHMKAINHPIVADKMYAPKMPHILGFERLALHASSICFKLLNGESRCFEAPLPADFEVAFSLMEKQG